MPPGCHLCQGSSLHVLFSLLLELLDCDDLHSVIRLVLKAGNYMNAVRIIFSKSSMNVHIMSDAFKLPFVPVLYCTDKIIKMYLLRVVTVQMPLASG